MSEVEITCILKTLEGKTDRLIKMVENLQRDHNRMKTSLGEIYNKINRLDSLCNDTNLDDHIKDVINATK